MMNSCDKVRRETPVISNFRFFGVIGKYKGSKIVENYARIKRKKRRTEAKIYGELAKHSRVFQHFRKANL